MQRFFRFNLNDGTHFDIEIAKVISIDALKMDLFSLEKMDNEKFRLIYSKSVIEDLTQVKNIEIIRID